MGIGESKVFIAEAGDTIASSDFGGIDGSHIARRAGNGGDIACVDGSGGGSVNAVESSCRCGCSSAAEGDSFIAEAGDADRCIGSGNSS